MTKKNHLKKTIRNICFLLLFGFLTITITKLVLPNNNKSADGNVLQVFDDMLLSEFDGTNPNKPVYIAYDGLVYDVSPGRKEFYDPEKPYHYLAGKDSTIELNIAGGTIIKSKYSVVGKYKK